MKVTQEERPAVRYCRIELEAEEVNFLDKILNSYRNHLVPPVPADQWSQWDLARDLIMALKEASQP